MTRIAILGGSGFVGSAMVARLTNAGMSVRSLPAPRLLTEARTAEALFEDAQARSRLVEQLVEDLTGSDIVINAAGIASATSIDESALHGANALLPAAVALAAEQLHTPRFIHISSAAVQGRTEVLDESACFDPTSSYVRSKVLAEKVLLLQDWRSAVILRPTSVHGPGRSITRILMRIARSPIATVASPGTAHTPQVHVAQVAQAVAVLCDTQVRPPKIMLQPSEGFTTAGFLELLSSRRPHLMPNQLSRSAISSAYAIARLSPRLWGQARRLEMLLLGQDQIQGWLASADASLTRPHTAWNSIAGNVAHID